LFLCLEITEVNGSKLLKMESQRYSLPATSNCLQLNGGNEE